MSKSDWKVYAVMAAGPALVLAGVVLCGVGAVGLGALCGYQDPGTPEWLPWLTAALPAVPVCLWGCNRAERRARAMIYAPIAEWAEKARREFGPENPSGVSK